MILSTYRIHLRNNLSVGEALKVHGSGRAGHCAGTAALAECAVDCCHPANLTDSVVVDFFFLIGDCSIGAYVCTGRAAVAEQLIRFCCACVGAELILGEKANGFDCCRAGLGYGLRDILRSLADTGKEHTGGGGLYRTKLRMSLGEEVVVVDAGCQHGSQF